MYKQLIIARKDLNMSPGIAFLLEKILWGSKEVVREREVSIQTETKVVCRAKNKDYFLIYDACRTEQS